jgi:hypothetical protein
MEAVLRSRAGRMPSFKGTGEGAASSPINLASPAADGPVPQDR